MSWPIAVLLFAQAVNATPPGNDEPVADSAKGQPSAAPAAGAVKRRDEWVAQPLPEQLSDAEACAMFQDKIEQQAPQLPMRLTYQRYRLHNSVDCAAKIFRSEDEIEVQPSTMTPGWQDFEQAEWNKEFCDGLLTLALTWDGWQFVKQVTFVGGQKFQFVVKCG